jgi:hypothetical protein
MVSDSQIAGLPELGTFFGKIVSRLNDEDLEHQHRVKRWPPAFRPVSVAERRI